jgi:glyoxylase-like metal-dependent hydrolase (beta-lactamase superfamily II)
VTVVLAGDASYTEANLQAGVIDGLAGNEAQAQSTPLRLRTLATERPVVFLPTHDPQTPESLDARRTVYPLQERREAAAVA